MVHQRHIIEIKDTFDKISKTLLEYGFLCFLLVFQCNFLFAQSINIGTSPIQNYSPKDYQAGFQNWDLEIAEDGTLYCANSDGLLSFDGERWSLMKQPSHSTGRSLSIWKDNNILFGGQDEIGYFNLNDNNHSYHSFLDVIPELNLDLEDIWQIKSHGDVIVFRSRYSVNMVSDDHFVPIDAWYSSNFLTLIDSTFYFNDFFSGIYQLDLHGNKSFIPGSEIFKEMAIYDMIRKDANTLLVFTDRDGIYRYEHGQFSKWELPADKYFREQQIISCLRLQDGKIAVGTRLGGLIILSEEGETLYKIDRSTGLQNNSITSIAQDAWGDLWLASYYGIEKVLLSSSRHTFYPDNELQGTIYDIELWEGQWWFGTANGLYTLPYQDYYDPLENIPFKYVKYSEGQVWDLDVVDGELYLGHNRGAFIVLKSGELQKMGELTGTWKFVALTDEKMAVGTYDGVIIFKKENNRWVEDYLVEGFDESARIMVKDADNNLWVSHPYRGIYKISFDSSFVKYEVKKYETSSGYKDEKNNYFSSILGVPVLTNSTGLYKYEPRNDKFVRDSIINSIFDSCGTIKRVFQKDNMIWYVSDTETGVIHIKNDGLKISYRKENFPELTNYFVPDFENLYFQDSNYQLICTNKGVVLHHSNEIQNSPQLKGYVQTIQLNSIDSFIVPNGQLVELAPDQNAVIFNFRTNGKANAELLGYSYKLEGHDNKWSEYNDIPFKEYSQLDYGDYTFLLKAMDKNGLESEVSSLSFVIQYPWYLSSLAYFLYSLFIISTVIALIWFPQKKYKKETAILVDKQQETEKQMEKIKKKQLESEIRIKNQELASSTLHLLQKNQTLLTLKEKIDSLNGKIKDPDMRKELHNLKSILHSDLRLDEDWDKFSMHFDQVHHDFIKKLKAAFPNLTKNDHKLCAYLKMGLSTKEIVPLLNISIRGVEISRYRLRKKLNLERSIKLSYFFNTEFE